MCSTRTGCKRPLAGWQADQMKRVIATAVVLLMSGFSGRAADAEICVERREFSVRLPPGWKEVRDDFCAPGEYFCYEDPAGGMQATLRVGRRSAGARMQELLKGELDRWRRKLAGRGSHEIRASEDPGHSDFEISGKSGTGRPFLVRIRGVEGPRHVGVVTHFGSAKQFESRGGGPDQEFARFKLR